MFEIDAAKVPGTVKSLSQVLMENALLDKMASAYQTEIERLFTEAEARGFVDPAFTREKRAAFYELEKTAGPEIMAQLDQVALEGMTPLDRLAIAGGLGKLAGMGGLGEWSSAAWGKAKEIASKVPWKKAPQSPFEGLGQSEQHYARMRKVLSKPEVVKKPHSIKGEFVSGAAFGAGFGALQRAVAPKAEPEVQIGERPD